jgi:hypothetical protein
MQSVEKENVKLLQPFDVECKQSLNWRVDDESDDNSWVVVEEMDHQPTVKQVLNSVSSNNNQCLECVNKDAAVEKLRKSEAVLKRDSSQIVLLQQQYVGMAQEINLIKYERDEALKKVKKLEIWLAEADSEIKSLLSKSVDVNCLTEDNKDLQSILSIVSAAFDRFERSLKEEIEYRQTINSENVKKSPCSSCSYKDQFFLKFRNEFVKATLRKATEDFQEPLI